MAFTTSNKKQPTKLHAIMSNFLLYNKLLAAKISFERTLLYCLALELSFSG